MAALTENMVKVIICCTYCNRRVIAIAGELIYEDALGEISATCGECLKDLAIPTGRA